MWGKMFDSLNNEQDHKQALDLINDLINGINPVTKSKFDLETVFSTPEIARALFYIRNKLTIDNEIIPLVQNDKEQTSIPTVIKAVEDPIKLKTIERRKLRSDTIDVGNIEFHDFVYVDNVGVVKFVKGINAHIRLKGSDFTVDFHTITNWLVNEGYMTQESDKSKKHITTPLGEALGINYKQVTINNNTIKMNIFSRSAQRHIIEHLKDIYL